MAEYWRCPDEVVVQTRKIIIAHHAHLNEGRILLLFRDQAGKKAGKLTAATASKMSAKDNAIADAAPPYAFKIIIANDLWLLNGSAWRRALIDHELCHCVGNSEDGWELLGHDIEEFAEVIERHGLWKADVKDFCERVVQLDLFGDPVAHAARDFGEAMQKTADEIGGSVSVGVGRGEDYKEVVKWDSKK